MSRKDDIQSAIASYISALRAERGLSATKMAALVGVDKHTWFRWESGASTPSIADLVLVAESLGASLLEPVLDTIYPEEDQSVFDDRTLRLRKDAAAFFMDKATDHQVHVWDYIFNSLHGSDVDAQIEEFCCIDHLPMVYRYFLAQQAYVYYMMARRNGDLINTNEVMPNMDVFVNGLKRGQKAAFDKLKSGL